MPAIAHILRSNHPYDIGRRSSRSPSLNVVELVSTRDKVRGRGYGAELTAAASVAAPDRPAMLIASDDGRAFYECLAYMCLQSHTLWIGPAT